MAIRVITAIFAIRTIKAIRAVRAIKATRDIRAFREIRTIRAILKYQESKLTVTSADLVLQLVSNLCKSRSQIVPM